MLSQGPFRRKILILVVLCGILVAGVAMIASRRADPVSRFSAGDLARLLGPASLPGGPLSDLAIGTGEPPPIVGADAALSNAQAPFLPVGPAAKPFRFAGTAEDHLRARTCLAAAMLYEAGRDPAGQMAVAQVVLNRVRHPAFPNTICGVVLQGSERATGCQFTFTCDGALSRRPDSRGWRDAFVRAEVMLNGFVFSGAGLATHYHTDAVYPWWSPKLEKIAQVGSHLFFRWPGYWGSPQATRTWRAVAEPAPVPLAHLWQGSDPVEPVPPTAPGIAPLRLALSSDVMAVPPEGSRAEPPPTGMQVPLARRLPPSSSEPPAQQRSLPVASAALGTSKVLRMFADEGVFFLQVAAQSSDRSRRRTAELLCGGRAQCRVYGWSDPTWAPASPQLTEAARQHLAFSFVRAPDGPKRKALVTDLPMSGV